MKPALSFILLCIVLFNFSCKKSAYVTISGNLDSAENVKVRIVNHDFTIFYDSTIIKNGKYKLVAKLPGDGFYQLNFNSPVVNRKSWSHSITFYAEDYQSYKVIATRPYYVLYDLYSVTSTSSTQNKLSEYNSFYKAKLDTLAHKKQHYLNLASAALDNSKMKLYSAYVDTVSMVEDEISMCFLPVLHNFIKNNPQTIVTPYLISQATDLFENYRLYKNVMDGLSATVKDSKYYDESSALLASVKNYSIGAKAPPIYGNDIYGKPLQIDYKKKKVILIDFWASYCGPCRDQIPDLKALYNKYRQKGFDIVSVSIDENSKLWKNAVEEEHIPWTNISESVQQEDSKNIKNFVIEQIPANYVVDGDGRFIARDISLDKLGAVLEKL